MATSIVVHYSILPYYYTNIPPTHPDGLSGGHVANGPHRHTTVYSCTPILLYSYTLYPSPYPPTQAVSAVATWRMSRTVRAASRSQLRELHRTLRGGTFHPVPARLQSVLQVRYPSLDPVLTLIVRAALRGEITRQQRRSPHLHSHLPTHTSTLTFHSRPHASSRS